MCASWLGETWPADVTWQVVDGEHDAGDVRVRVGAYG